MREKRAWPLALAHGLNDGYGTFLPALLPLLIDRLGLSLTLAGLLTSIQRGVASFGQWPLGMAADRYGPRRLAILGPAITVLSMGLLGVMPTYWSIAALLVLAGLGTATFHPAGAALVPQGGGRGLRMALFSAGGTLGAALGPILITQTAARVGLLASPLLLLPALAILVLLARTIPSNPQRSESPALSLRHHPARAEVLRLWGIAASRELVGVCLTGFLAVLWTRRGAPLTLAGLALTVYSLASAAGNLFGGRLSDRVGRRGVLVGGLILSLPCFYLFLLTDGRLSFSLLAATGVFLGSSVPVCVVYAQELVPEQRGLVSGLLMGLAWGVGSLLIVAIGALADLIGLEPALGIVGLALLPAIFLALSLRRGLGTPEGERQSR